MKVEATSKQLALAGERVVFVSVRKAGSIAVWERFASVESSDDQ